MAMAPPSDLRHTDTSRDESLHSGRGAFTNVAVPERVASGLAGAALTAYAISKRRDVAGAAMALAGGMLLHRSLTGHCMVYGALHTGSARPLDSEAAVIPHGQGIKVTKTVTIDKSREELYSFWRNFENLPRFMAHLESVKVFDDNRSHWVAKGPLGKNIEWDAEIINEKPDEMIAWRSVEPADIPNTGSVWFKTVPGGRGTEVTVTLEYNPPGGVLGAAIARLFGEEPGVQVRDDLLHFKSLMEAGEIPTIEGQPQGTRGRSPVDRFPGVGHAPEKRENITSFDETAFSPA